MKGIVAFIVHERWEDVANVEQVLKGLLSR